MEIRQAIRHDARAVWEWRNDPVTLAMQPDPTPIPYYVHADWFTAMLGNPKRVMFIGVVDGERVGYVRFNLDLWHPVPGSGTSAEVDVAIAPEHRGKGYGTEMIRLATAELRVRVCATIRAENIASQRAFVKAGYTLMTHRERHKINPANGLPPGHEDDPWVDDHGFVFCHWGRP